MSEKSKYRTTNIIIQTILEGILRADRNKPNQKEGIIKSHLIKYSSLKTATAEKYLSKMENAGYITSHEESWGERKIIVYKITSIGRERYKWFAKINTELEQL